MEIKVHQYCVDPRSDWRYGWVAKKGNKLVEVQTGFTSRCSAEKSANAFTKKHNAGVINRLAA